MLNSEIAACLAEGADIEAQQYDEIQAVIRSIMVKRIGGAQDRLQRILSKRTSFYIVVICRIHHLFCNIHTFPFPLLTVLYHPFFVVVSYFITI